MVYNRSMRANFLAPTFRSYEVAWLGPDVVAGLTLVAVAVPEQIATAKLAGMPATAGLYAFIAGSLIFALLGRDPHISVGADSTIAPLIATAVAGLAVAGSGGYTTIASLLALMVGALVLAVGLLRLGWVAEFLSTPVVTGVLGGIAVQIFVRQLPAVLGLKGGGATVIQRLRAVGDQIGHANGWSIGIALVVLALIVAAERVSRRIPGALGGLVVSIAAVSIFGLQSHGVAVLGTIHGGLPSFRFPTATLSQVTNLISVALTIAFLCVAQSAATVRSTGDGAPAADDFNRDIAAVGAGSLLAGVSGSFAVNVSPPRTAIVNASGGKSQLSSVVAAGVALVVVLAATGVLKNLPEAALGGTLIFVSTRLFRVAEMRSIWQFDRIEFGMTAVTLLIVALVGIEQGVLAAMLLSLAARTRRIARPADAVLGRETGTDHWIPCDIGRDTEQIPGVLVYMVYAALWYGNADFVRLRINSLLAAAETPVRLLVIDANGMSDIDFTGSEALGQIVEALRARSVTIAVARSSHMVHRGMKHGGLLAKIGPDHLFPSVEEAVAALGSRAA